MNNDVIALIKALMKGVSDKVRDLKGSVLLEERISSLTETGLASESVVESIGIPVYVDDVAGYSEYGLTETGWYIFARILSKDGGAIASGVTVEGADGSIITAGEDHVDIAVRFDVASMSRQVTVNWGTETETFTFKATDLAIRNLDYRTTFYVYPLDEFIAWTYTETTDTSFVSGKHYYTKDENDVYTEAEVTEGEAVPAGTYYVHSKARFEGFTRNITYRYTGVIDCPIEIVLPDIPEDGYGAWVEFQLRYNDTYSATLIPPADDVKAAKDSTPAQTRGINVLDLHYLSVNDLKVWRLINTHSGYDEA